MSHNIGNVWYKLQDISRSQSIPDRKILPSDGFLLAIVVFIMHLLYCWSGVCYYRNPALMRSTELYFVRLAVQYCIWWIFILVSCRSASTPMYSVSILHPLVRIVDKLEWTYHSSKFYLFCSTNNIINEDHIKYRLAILAVHVQTGLRFIELRFTFATICRICSSIPGLDVSGQTDPWLHTSFSRGYPPGLSK